MKIIDIVSSPWAILPEKYDSILNVYNEYVKGPKIETTEYKALLNKQNGKEEERSYQIINGKAIIEISGPMMKNPNFFLRWLFGALSMEEIGEAVRDAVNDRKVEMILLKIDSPGGTVDGTEVLGKIIFEARGEKPIISFTDGVIASAAYWVGSAADEMFISGETIISGSIGVATYHVEYSEAYKKYGVKVTDIYSGKYKRIATENKPLTKEGKAYIQSQIDSLYKIFVDTVAKHRGVESKKVLTSMADGKIFIGSEAVSAGLIDGVLSLEEILGMDAKDFKSENNFMEAKEMPELNFENLKMDHPQIFEQAKAEGKTEAEKAFNVQLEKEKSTAKEEGQKSENERVKAIYSLNDFGHSEVKKECIDNMDITAGDAAIKFNQAEQGQRSQAQENLNNDGIEGVAGDNSQEANEAEKAKKEAQANSESEKDFMVLVNEHQKANNCKKGESIKAIVKSNPEAHKAFLKKSEEKNV